MEWLMTTRGGWWWTIGKRWLIWDHKQQAATLDNTIQQHRLSDGWYYISGVLDQLQALSPCLNILSPPHHGSSHFGTFPRSFSLFQTSGRAWHNISKPVGSSTGHPLLTHFPFVLSSSSPLASSSQFVSSVPPGLFLFTFSSLPLSFISSSSPIISSRDQNSCAVAQILHSKVFARPCFFCNVFVQESFHIHKMMFIQGSRGLAKYLFHTAFTHQSSDLVQCAKAEPGERY